MRYSFLMGARSYGVSYHMYGAPLSRARRDDACALLSLTVGALRTHHAEAHQGISVNAFETRPIFTVKIIIWDKTKAQNCLPALFAYRISIVSAHCAVAAMVCPQTSFLRERQGTLRANNVTYTPTLVCLYTRMKPQLSDSVPAVLLR